MRMVELAVRMLVGCILCAIFASLACDSARAANTISGITVAPVTSPPYVFGEYITYFVRVTGTNSADAPTGTITLTGESGGSGSAVLSPVSAALSSANVVVNSLPVGSNHIDVSYSGDSNYPEYTVPDAVSPTVNMGKVTGTMTSSINPSYYGQLPTATITVKPMAPATGMPTGTVTVTMDGDVQPPLTLDGGSSATFDLPLMTARMHSITATYSGDTSFKPSTGIGIVAFVQDVLPDMTTTTLTLIGPPGGNTVQGQALQYSAHVSSAHGQPATGYITPSIAGNIFPGLSAPLDANGNLTSSIAQIGGSAGGLLFIYNFSAGGQTPNANFVTSTSNTIPWINNPAATTTLLTVTPNPDEPGHQLTLSASVKPVAPAQGGIPGGATVTFTQDSNVVGTAATGPNGVATLVLPTGVTLNGPLNGRTIQASFAGTSSFLPSTSEPVVLTFAVLTTTTVTSASSTTVQGQPVSVTATITDDQGIVHPTGTVSFTQNGILLGTANVVLSGTHVATATLSGITTLPGGTDTITASYSGDSSFGASSGTCTQVVTAAPTTTTLTASPNPSQDNGTVALIATVANAASGNIPPTGTVSFYNGATLLATTALGGTQTAATTAAFPTLLSGYSLTAMYNGDASNAPSTSTAVIEIVNADAPIPVATSMAPTSVQEGSPDTTVIISGSNFVDDATVMIGNTAVTPTAISPTSITCTIPANLLASPANFDVSVVNPSPGGGPSTPTLAFAVTEAPLTASAASLTEPPATSFSAIVATFTSGDTSEPASNFTATVDWGDGSMTSPVDGSAVVVASTGPGAYSVTGTHTYAQTGSYAAIVSITDTGGSTAGTSSNVTVEPASVNYPSGLQMIGLPYDYSADPFHFDAASILGLAVSPVSPFNAKIVTFDPVAFAYDVYPSLPGGTVVGDVDLTGKQTLPGVGYWIRETTGTEISQFGAIVPSPFNLTVNPGWNLIADPFTNPIAESDLLFAADHAIGSFQAGAVETLADAQADGLIPGSLFGYQQSPSSYFIATSLEPFAGYWLYIDPGTANNEPVTVTFTNPHP